MESREPRNRDSLFAALAILVMLVVFYFASVGPVVMLSEQSGIGRNAVRVVYAPLVWLHDKTPLKKPLEWYVGLFGVK